MKNEDILIESINKSSEVLVWIFKKRITDLIIIYNHNKTVSLKSNCGTFVVLLEYFNLTVKQDINNYIKTHINDSSNKK